MADTSRSSFDTPKAPLAAFLYRTLGDNLAKVFKDKAVIVWTALHHSMKTHIRCLDRLFLYRARRNDTLKYQGKRRWTVVLQS